MNGPSFQIQNTQENKRTLFNWTKEDKTCTIFEEVLFQATYKEFSVLTQMVVAEWSKPGFGLEGSRSRTRVWADALIFSLSLLGSGSVSSP